MPISLVQRLSQRGTLHVWIAVANVTQAPALAWTLDGAPAAPRPLRELESARTPEQLPNGNPARAFAGLYEFDDPRPGLQHVVGVAAGAERASLAVRAVPAAVPPAGMTGEALRILLVSCFHTKTDPRGLHVGRHAAALIQQHRPDLTLFLGDQVYLDLPVFGAPLVHRDTAIAADLEAKYLANWMPASSLPAQRGYYEVLAAAPAVFNADDHEYWNNYPHFQPQLHNTWTPTLRGLWTAAARRLWSVFQLQHGVELGQPFVIDDIAPLSMLFVDTRSTRTGDALFDGDAVEKINAWADAFVESSDRVGVLVSGQPLFAKKSRVGSLLDKNLLDFPKQYDVLVNAVKRVAAKRPVLCITGDVHYGRVLAVEGSKESGRLFEVISSPAALVDNPVQNVTAALNPFDDPIWPKHGQAPKKESDLHFAAFPGEQFVNAHAQRGNHVVLLSLTRTGASITVDALYRQVHPKRELPDGKVRFTLR